jgi:hypothetical protein
MKTDFQTDYNSYLIVWVLSFAFNSILHNLFQHLNYHKIWLRKFSKAKIDFLILSQ